MKLSIRKPTVIIVALVTALFCLVSGISASNAFGSSPPAPASPTVTYACIGYNSNLGQRVIFGAYTTLSGYQTYLKANTNDECPLSGSGDTVSATPARDADSWPFTYDSVWNIPIASTATYAAAGITSNHLSETGDTSDYDSTNPSFPVVTLLNANTYPGSPTNEYGNNAQGVQTIGAVSVYADPGITAGLLVPTGAWNTCSAWLGTDGETLYQGQTTEVNSAGQPYFGGAGTTQWGTVQIKGDGVTGCHGGSGLSGLGGTLTLADLSQSGPITHALKVALDGVLNYSDANGGFRWPAVNADLGYNDPSSGNYYGGSNPNVQEGSLLALPPSISPSSFSNPFVQKIATAMQDYGAYIVDTTANGMYDNSSVITNYNAAAQLVTDVCTSDCTDSSAFSSQLNTLLTELEVVTNNTSSTPGGGAIGASRCALYAPEFTDGTDAPSYVPVVGC